ncbi:MAG: exopolyphosphatase, partial [Hyphomicrobiales bacterium]
MAKNPETPAMNSTGPLAVVDIGSNSVRLNIYEGGRRSPALLYNEKSICGLGRGVTENGQLAPDAVSSTLGVLARFGVLISHMGVARIEAVATAAVREAGNGSQFVTDASQVLGARIRVLSGGEEGRLAALGVLSSTPDARGIVADLGGGSLEIVVVGAGGAEQGETMPLGSLRLRDKTLEVEVARAVAEDALGQMQMLTGARGQTLYAVGGSWRALARVHMATTGHPLQMIDGYRISALEAGRIARLVTNAPAEWLRGIPGFASARQEILPFAAVVMFVLLQRMQPENVVFSARGVREGLAFATLPEAVAAQDPLVVGCAEMAEARALDPNRVRIFADELFAWLEGLVYTAHQPDIQQERRLRRCICLLADIGWRAHPDFRGARSLELIAHATLTGVDHGARAFMALAVYFSHKPRVEGELCASLAGLVGKAALAQARKLGAALRLAE